MSNLFDDIKKQQQDAVLQSEINSRICQDEGVKLKMSFSNDLLILKGERIKNYRGEYLQHVSLYKICDRIIWIDENNLFIAIVEMKEGYRGPISDLLAKFENGINEANRILDSCGRNIHSYRWGFFLVYIDIPGSLLTALSQKKFEPFGRDGRIRRCKHKKKSQFDFNPEYLLKEFNLSF